MDCSISIYFIDIDSEESEYTIAQNMIRDNYKGYGTEFRIAGKNYYNEHGNEIMLGISYEALRYDIGEVLLHEYIHQLLELKYNVPAIFHHIIMKHMGLFPKEYNIDKKVDFDSIREIVTVEDKTILKQLQGVYM